VPNSRIAFKGLCKNLGLISDSASNILFQAILTISPNPAKALTSTSTRSAAKYSTVFMKPTVVKTRLPNKTSPKSSNASLGSSLIFLKISISPLPKETASVPVKKLILDVRFTKALRIPATAFPMFAPKRKKESISVSVNILTAFIGFFRNFGLMSKATSKALPQYLLSVAPTPIKKIVRPWVSSLRPSSTRGIAESTAIPMTVPTSRQSSEVISAIFLNQPLMVFPKYLKIDMVLSTASAAKSYSPDIVSVHQEPPITAT